MMISLLKLNRNHYHLLLIKNIIHYRNIKRYFNLSNKLFLLFFLNLNEILLYIIIQ